MCKVNTSVRVSAGPSSKDAESDEEWPDLGEEQGEGPAEVEVDLEDEQAIQMFMNKNPPVR